MNTINKFTKYLLFALLCFAFSSCETDIDKMYVRSTDSVTAPVLTSEGFTDIVVDEYNVNLVPFVLNWTRSNFGTGVLVEYAIEMDTDADFSNSYVVTVGNDIYNRVITGAELSRWVIANFNGLNAAGDPVRVDFYLRIQASVALENPMVTVPPDKKFSNIIPISVVPYVIPGSYPEEMYMIGAEFGNWDWDSPGVVEMVPVHSNAGHFWCIRYITANEPFKWNSKRAWGGDFNSLGDDIGFTLDGGNAVVATDGMYMVYMDMPNGRISIEPARVYGIGDAFGSWNMGAAPFTVENKTMVGITTDASADGGLRIYAISDIAPIGGDWWKMEFIIRNGVIEYRGAGDDQEPRIPAVAGQKLTLDFNAGTGSIQ
jgi:hypothetical protein